MPRTPTTIDSILTHARWTPDEARAALAAQATSGLSISAFAKRHSLQPQRLYRWHRQLPATLATRAPANAPTFVEIAASRVAPAQSARYELCLASGGTLRVEGAPDPATVRSLLAVLREVEAC